MRDRIAIIDINTKKFKAISYKQYDENNILQIVITENGNIIGLSNYSAVVKFQLPSGVVYKIPSIIENNTIKLILTRAILSEYGKVIVEIVLQDTKQLITTFSIYLNVEKSINNENSQLPEMDITSDYLHRHENKEVLDQITQEMIDSILEFEELLELDVYATKDYVQSEIEKIDINTDNLDLSNYYTKEEVDEKFENIDISTDNIDLSNYATKEELPTKVSQLENDLNYLTSIPEEYVTETELNNKGYLTEHQDISHLATKNELFSGSYNDLTDKPNIPSLDGYATETYVKNEIANAQLGGENNKIDLSGYATKDELNAKASIEDIPTKVSQLENDSKFITSIPNEYVTDEELDNKGYLTEHQDLSHLATKEELNNKADKSSVPTKVSQLENDSNYLTNIPEEYITNEELNNKGYLTEHQDISGKADKTELFSKDYNDLINKPSIPSLDGYATENYVKSEIANAQLGGEGNEVDLSGYATKDDLNGKANKTDIPTKVSQLENDNKYISSIPSEYITETELNQKGYLTEHQDISGKADKSEIPTKTSQLNNDSGYLTSVPSEYITEIELNEKGFLTEHQDISNKADKSEIPTKTSQLTNDSGFITSVPSEYVTETELNEKGYLTEHQDISGKADKTELFSKDYNDLTNKPDIPSVDGFVSKDDMSNYATKSDLSTLVTKETNKSLVDNTLIDKLEDLENYDDSLVREEIDSINSQLAHIENNLHYVNVKKYGVSGEDGIDDTEKIQKCIDENSCIFFPPGIYNYKILKLKNNLKILGDNAILKCLDASITNKNMASITPYFNDNMFENVFIDNLIFDGNKELIEGNWYDIIGIFALNDETVSNINITNCKFLKFKEDAIRFMYSENASVSNININNCIFDGVYSDETYSLNAIRFIINTYVDTYGVYPVSNININNCKAYQCRTLADIKRGCKNVNITNCYTKNMHDCHHSVDGSKDVILSNIFCEMTENFIPATGTNFIEIQGEDIIVSNVIANGNNVTKDGIMVQDYGHPDEGGVGYNSINININNCNIKNIERNGIIFTNTINSIIESCYIENAGAHSYTIVSGGGNSDEYGNKLKCGLNYFTNLRYKNCLYKTSISNTLNDDKIVVINNVVNENNFTDIYDIDTEMKKVKFKIDMKNNLILNRYLEIDESGLKYFNGSESQATGGISTDKPIGCVNAVQVIDNNTDNLGVLSYGTKLEAKKDDLLTLFIKAKKHTSDKFGFVISEYNNDTWIEGDFISSPVLENSWVEYISNYKIKNENTNCVLISILPATGTNDPNATGATLITDFRVFKE